MQMQRKRDYRFGLIGMKLGHPRNAIWILALVLVAALFGILTYEDLRDDRARNGLRQNALDYNNSLALRLHSELSELVNQAKGLVFAVETAPDLAQARFGAMAAEITRDNPNLINVALSPDFIVRYVWPLEGNESVLGFDVLANENQRHVAERAIREDRVLIAAPVALVQGGTGIIARAVIVNDATDEPWGMAAIVADYDQLLANVGITPTASISTEGGQTYEMNVNVRVEEETHLGSGEYDFAITSSSGPDPEIRLSLAGQDWLISTVPVGGWSAVHADRSVTIPLYVVGLVLVLGIFVFFYRLASARKVVEAQLESALDVLSDGFAYYDADDRIVYCNQNYREMYGIPPELIDRHATFEEIVRDGVSRGQIRSAIGKEEEWIRERLAVHHAGVGDVEQQLADGRWIRQTDRRLADGSLAAFRVDITDLRRSQAEAERANVVKSRFLALVSHELRTPLTVMYGYARLLRSIRSLGEWQGLEAELKGQSFDHIEAMGSRIENMADSSLAAGDQLQSLISELIDYSQMVDGAFEIYPETVSCQMLLDTTVAKHAARAQAKGLQLSAETADFQVDVDVQRMCHVLDHLVDNAIKYTSEGSIIMGATDDDFGTSIYVQDTGIGIDPDLQDQMFDAFRQHDDSDTRAQGGTGLGLAMCREIVALHGGRISVESEPGKGARFVVRIPVARDVRLSA